MGKQRCRFLKFQQTWHAFFSRSGRGPAGPQRWTTLENLLSATPIRPPSARGRTACRAPSQQRRETDEWSFRPKNKKIKHRGDSTEVGREGGVGANSVRNAQRVSQSTAAEINLPSPRCKETNIVMFICDILLK